MVVTKFIWENSCRCVKRAEGDLGCLSFFQENKDVIQYLVLPQAWGVTSVVFVEFWAPLAWGSIYTFAHGLINGMKRSCSPSSGLMALQPHQTPMGAVAPVPTLGRSQQDSSPSKPNLQVATPVDLHSTKEVFLCHQSVRCSGFNWCQNLFLKWN